MIAPECLRKLPFCQKLSPEELQQLCHILSRHSFQKIVCANEPLTQLGEEIRYVYLVEQGLLRSVNYTPTGEEIFFYYFTEGAMINLVNAVGGEKNFSQFISMRESCLHCIPVENLHHALRTLPNFTYEVLEYVAGRALEQVRLSVISRQKRTRERICSYLYMHYTQTREPVYRTPFTIELLAKTLNLTRSAMSKELHQLEDEGLISISKNLIHIKQPEKLADDLFL